MKVLVTGAAGYLGTELVPQLLAQKHSVRALVRVQQNTAGVETLHRSLANAASCRELGAGVETSSGRALHAAPCREPWAGVETFSGSLPDAALCQQLCAGVDAVVHLANIAHVNAAADLLKTHNLDATVELATAAKAQGVRKFIFISSSKARYPGHSAYARYKAETESALRKLHAPGSFEVVCLRPALIYGPGMKGNLRGLLRVLSRPALPLFVASGNSLGLISVHDVARAILAALVTNALPDKVWELADGTHYTLDAIVQRARALQGLPQPLLMLPRPLFWTCAALATILSPLIKTSLSLSTYNALFTETYFADSQFSLHTGFAPQDNFFSKLPALLEHAKQ